MKVLLNTSPLGNAHAMRGIGMYTRMLQTELSQLPDLELVSQLPADLIHYPFFDLFFATLPIKKKLPTIVTIHDVIPLLYPDHYAVGFRGRARYLKQKLALRTVKAIITDSFASKYDIIDHLGVPAAKVFVVHLAANPELVPPSAVKADRIREKLALPEKYVLYVGDINYNKNVPQLVKAFKFLPSDYQLVCVGKNFFPHDIPEWEDIDRQIALSDVASQIRFITDISSDDVTTLAAIYQGALCYVQPSLAEGFGLPVLEAMQCQTPVVAAGNSSLLEIGGSHVVYTGTDAEAIAAAVQSIASWTKADRASWIKSAANWAKTFSWSQAARQTLQVYKQVMAESV